jgi:hypothetical protein
MANSFVTQCMAMTEQNAAAAVLLMRVRYWTPRAKIVIDGLVWIANSRETWMKETALTLRKYDRALAVLKELGLVVTRQAHFRGRNITHLRATAKAQAELGLLDTRHVRKGVECAKAGTVEYAKSGTPIRIRKTLSSKSLRKTSCDRSVAKHDPVPEDGKMATVRELLASSPKLKKISPKSPGLAEVWRDTLIATYGGYVAPLTQKQAGQLAHFRKACPPDPAPAAVLRTAIREWGDLVATIQSDTGLKEAPPKPALGFLLQHVSAAVSRWQHKTAVKGLQLTAKAPVPVEPLPTSPPEKVPAPTAPSPPASDKASLAEVLAILGDDG